MGYYCTVPQCTSLAGKTKNVKFHKFPGDKVMANKWNTILKRGKPITIYSKVCSLHFTQADYNVTTVGQWKTLSKDAIPTQNLPKLNPDGTVMVIRKTRTMKYKDIKKEDNSDINEKWSPIAQQTISAINSDTLHTTESRDTSFAYRLQALNAIANNMNPQIHNQSPLQNVKPKKQDAFMQTDPINDEEDSQMNTSYETENSYTSDLEYQYQYKTQDFEDMKKFDVPKDYSKENEYITPTNDQYNKEAENYALERKTIDTSPKMEYPKAVEYIKIPEIYTNFNEKDFETRQEYVYGTSYSKSVDMLRNQQQNLQLLQEQHRINENQNFFTENHIKEELDFNNEEEKFLYENNKNQIDTNIIYDGSRRIIDQQRIMEQMEQIEQIEQIEQQVKQEPDVNNGCETIVTPQESPYYTTDEQNINGCYSQVTRPGPELLIAKQNALAAHTQLWQNTMKRPFFYSDSPRFYTQPVHRYEDLSRILQ